MKNNESICSDLTVEQLKEKELSEKEAKLINKEIIYIIKFCLFTSLIILIILLINSII